MQHIPFVLTCWWEGFRAAKFWPSAMLVMLVGMFQVAGHAQRGGVLQELNETASELFEAKSWEKAHRAYAELLSLDGTNVHLQTRYAATLLHDDRSRVEGIQRLAALAEQDLLLGEGMFWWGKSWMLQGKPDLAKTALEQAISQADKKSSWLEDCLVALDQCEDLPTQFPSIQNLTKLDVVEVPAASFHRYVQWKAHGIRLMSVPEELQSKRDRKAGIRASVALRRSTKDVLFHSLGPKAEQGLDIWLASLNEKGDFDKPTRLPPQINSPYDEINPVWDEAAQCLTFGSNRPGTMGGMDIFKSCKEGGAWSEAKPLGPRFNSIHDDLAYYPFDTTGVTGWLVTTRKGEFGAVEVWEVEPDGGPTHPQQVWSTWDMGEDAVPGVLTLYDAKSNKPLARVEMQHDVGQWGVVLSSGQVIHYVYETSEGIHAEGTYALPASDSPSVVQQQMKWSPANNDIVVSCNLQDVAEPIADNVTWSWNVVLEDIPTIAAEEWSRPELNEALTPTDPTIAEVQARRIVKFQSYPWWTDLQKEERDIAASILVQHQPISAEHWPDPFDHEDFNAYESSFKDLEERATDAVIQSVVSRAAADVIMEDASWDDALSAALDAGAEMWASVGWPREVLERKSKRLWAEAGATFDQGTTPVVRDKRGVVGDGLWIEQPWQDGSLLAHLHNVHWSSHLEADVMALTWSLARQSTRLDSLVSSKPSVWTDTRFWLPAMASVADPLKAHGGQASGVSGLAQQRTDMQHRLTLLESLEGTAEFDEVAIVEASRAWQTRAVPLLAGNGMLRLNDAPMEAAVDSTVANERRQHMLESEKGRRESVYNPLEAGLQEAWRLDWQKKMGISNSGALSRDLANWRDDMMAWLAETVSQEALPQPLLRRCLDRKRLRFDADEALTMPTTLTKSKEALSEDIGDLCEAMLTMAGAEINIDEAFGLLEATWLLTAWLHDDAWLESTLDQALVELDRCPTVVSKALPNLRVKWAQVQSELAANPLNATDVEEGAVSDLRELQSIHDVVDANHRVKSAETNKTSEIPATNAEPFDLGERGIHLGWFRNPPQVGTLPKGTQLVHVEGKQGLKRWVLLFENENGRAPSQSSLSAWLGNVGVPDAYEVQWDGGIWTRKRQPVDIEGASAEENRAASDAAAETVWASGRPVPLDSLDGTWHAVQVGVFAGKPEAAWLTSVSDRLVKETLPDGRARWYVATGRDANSAFRALEELRSIPDFRDAFIVKLNDGRRDMATDSKVPHTPHAIAYTPAQETIDAAVSNADSGFKTLEDVRRRDPELSQLWNDANQVEDGQPQMAPSVATMWHVAIQTYNDGVPAHEVAAFLINSAEWGVRSVELFGQTTYYSRSFIDLKQAQTMLEDIRSEGFTQAKVEALN